MSTHPRSLTSRLTDLLIMGTIGEDRFLARPAGDGGFLYGGLTMAIVTSAAGATVEGGLTVKSLRTSFLTFGEWAPMEVSVARVNGTRRFADRRAEVVQSGRTLAVADVTFHRAEEGVDRQSLDAPELTGPDDLAPMDTLLNGADPMELRPVGGVDPMAGRIHPYWARIRQALGPDPLAHASGLAFMSDYMVVHSPFDPATREAAGFSSFTLEHSLWFHRPFRADGWLLFDAAPLSWSGGRFVSRGTVHDQKGRLIGSFVQEGVVRPRR